MALRVRASGRNGRESDREASHESVHGIKTPGTYWAVDAKVEGKDSRLLRDGAIVRYWGTEEAAQADCHLISRGLLFYKRGEHRYYDPVITEAVAYEV